MNEAIKISGLKKSYGTHVVGGTSPGKKGSDVHGVPDNSEALGFKLGFVAAPLSRRQRARPAVRGQRGIADPVRLVPQDPDLTVGDVASVVRVGDAPR